MNFKTITRRVAATGGVAALAAGALVGATTTSAHADPEVTNEYTCTFGESQFPVWLDTNALGIENFTSIAAGFSVPAGLLTVTNTFTIPSSVYDQLSGFGVQSVSVPTFAGSFGNEEIAVDGVSVTVAGMTDNGNGTHSSNDDDADANGLPDEGNGTNAGFTVPVAGSYSILSPDELTLVASTAGGALEVPCVIKAGTTPGAYHQITVTKNATTTTGEATKAKFEKGAKAKVAAAVTGGNLLQGDKVLLKMGKKTLDDAKLNKKGQAVLVTKALPVGENTVTVVYKANGYNNGSKSEKITVKVVK